MNRQHSPYHALLKAKNLKVTKSRMAILEILEKSNQPLDVQAMIAQLQIRTIAPNPTTVYRMLETFVASNLIKRIDFLEGKFRYELNNHHHHHLVCQKCHIIQPIDNCSLGTVEANIQNTYHFNITNHSLEFFGTCQACS